ncbi:response regulator transcription factor [Taibaiella helva]|uniref:response regulator transcription factor n=1 Tax=Taibaiella helva TaxID=2301235 RepID=UPI000E56B517|nr:response regulator transcription factor [Taibaiella helva]
MKSVKIAILESRPFVSEGIEKVLEDAGAFEVCLKTETAESLFRQLSFMKEGERPDIIVLNLLQSGATVYDTIDTLREWYPEIKLLICADFQQETVVENLLNSGISVLMPTSSRPVEIAEALRTIVAGELYCSANVSKDLLVRFHDDRLRQELTAKEIEFLKFCCLDLTYKEIASRMHISVRTVHHYRDNLFLKLNVRTKTGLLLYAMSAGFVPLK